MVARVRPALQCPGGASTGAVAERAGLLRQSDGGLLFLDEIGDLGLDEQAMLLEAIEERRSAVPWARTRRWRATSSSSPDLPRSPAGNRDRPLPR